MLAVFVGKSGRGVTTTTGRKPGRPNREIAALSEMMIICTVLLRCIKLGGKFNGRNGQWKEN
jgi:hypothetical protein